MSFFKIGDIFDPNTVTLDEAIKTLSLKRAEAKELGYTFYYRGKKCKNGHLNFSAWNYGCIECYVRKSVSTQIEIDKRLNDLISRIKTQVIFLNTDHEKLFDKNALSHPESALEARKQGLTKFFPRYPCRKGHVSLCAINREKYTQCLMCLDELKAKYPERYLNYSRQYEDTNREKRNKRRNAKKKNPTARKKRNKQRRERYKKDINYRINQVLRARVKTFITGKNKSISSLELIGCDVEELRKYLELQFEKGMTWENYGEWHIDHIRAISFFDLTDEEQQKKCFHYSNLQPLWAFENMSKGGTNRINKKS